VRTLWRFGTTPSLSGCRSPRASPRASTKIRVYDRNDAPLNLRPDDDLVEEAHATAEGRNEVTVRAFVTALGHKEVCFK
jgi:hypothetical protein